MLGCAIGEPLMNYKEQYRQAIRAVEEANAELLANANDSDPEISAKTLAKLTSAIKTAREVLEEWKASRSTGRTEPNA